MRNINLRSSNKKKVRGVKRKCKAMIQAINELTERIPEIDIERGNWHMHLPVAETLTDSVKTPHSLRITCMQALIDRASYLASLKKDTKIPTRVVALINLTKLWDSQIIVFVGNEYYDSFFVRDTEEQKWIPIVDGDIARRFNLKVPEGFQTRGYIERILDEDCNYLNELWFIGELN